MIRKAAEPLIYAMKGWRTLVCHERYGWKGGCAALEIMDARQTSLRVSTLKK